LPVRRSNAGQQTDCAVAFVLVLTREGRMFPWLGRQVRRGGGDGLDAGLFIIGDDRHRIAGLLFRSGRRLQDLRLAINAQDLGPFLGEGGIEPFQIISILCGFTSC